MQGTMMTVGQIILNEMHLRRRQPVVRFVLAVPMALVAVAAIAAAPVQPGALPDTLTQRVIACTACHGKEGRAGSDGYYPRIAGKPAGYLYNQLQNFREGRRRYPLMTYMVAHLPDAYLHEVADYFSSLHPPYSAPAPVDVTTSILSRGQQLALHGDPAKNVPACVACHGSKLTGVVPAVPGLLGVPRDYLNAQFGAWQNGVRHTIAPDCMAQIATRLSLDDISAVTAWLASQTVPNDSAPAASSSAKRPIACGSAPEQGTQQ
jgi:cytochrome c553